MALLGFFFFLFYRGVEAEGEKKKGERNEIGSCCCCCCCSRRRCRAGDRSKPSTLWIFGSSLAETFFIREKGGGGGGARKAAWYVVETEQYKHTLLPSLPHNIFFAAQFPFFPSPQIRELFCQRRKKKKTFLISSAPDFEGINIRVLPLPILAFSCAQPKKKRFPLSYRRQIKARNVTQTHSAGSRISETRCTSPYF